MASNDEEDLMAEFFVMPDLEEGEIISGDEGSVRQGNNTEEDEADEEEEIGVRFFVCLGSTESILLFLDGFLPD